MSAEKTNTPAPTPGGVDALIAHIMKDTGAPSVLFMLEPVYADASNATSSGTAAGIRTTNGFGSITTLEEFVASIKNQAGVDRVSFELTPHFPSSNNN